MTFLKLKHFIETHTEMVLRGTSKCLLAEFYLEFSGSYYNIVTLKQHDVIFHNLYKDYETGELKYGSSNVVAYNDISVDLLKKTIIEYINRFYNIGKCDISECIDIF